MSARYNILFLCTGNSARSILAEAIANLRGGSILRAWSAGSHPKGAVHPQALALLRKLDFPTDGLRSKSWDEFTAPGAPQFDFIVTVCDNAANETCPVWPGKPVTAHWGIPDPAAVEGTEAEIALAFADAFRAMERRISLFLALPLASLDSLAMEQRMKEIGRTADSPAKAH
jgi:protein-tyrosine-phosphatase